MEESTLKDMILVAINIMTPQELRVNFIEGEWASSTVYISIVFLPTNNIVHRIPSKEVRTWNQLGVCGFGKIAQITYVIRDDAGLFIVICTPSQHSLVLDMAGAAGWRENHNIVALCVTPHFKDDELTKRSLLICVFAKSNVKHNFAIPHPSFNTWCDSL